MIAFIKRWTSSEHERVCQDLSAYLDDELSAAHRSQLERHLQHCKACREELSSLRRTVELVHALPSVKLPRSFLLRPSEAVAQRQVRRARLGYSYLQAATAAATALLILVVSGDALLRYRFASPAGVPSATEVLAAPSGFGAQPAAGTLSIAPTASPEGVAAEAETSALSQVQSGQEATEQSPGVARALPPAAGSPSPQPIAPLSTASPDQGPSLETLALTPVPQTAKSGTGGADHTDNGSPTVQAAGTTQPLGALPNAAPWPQQTEGIMPTLELPSASPLQPSTAAVSPEQMDAASAMSPEATASPVRLAALASPQTGSTPMRERGQSAPNARGWLAPLLSLRPYMGGLERALAILAAALAAAMLWLRKRRR